MRKIIASLLVLLVLLVAYTSIAATTVYFSPKGGCTKAVVDNINKATNSIYLAIYTFTSDTIANALTNAIGRGISVNVIVDGREGTNWLADAVIDGTLPCLFDKKHTRMHDKYLIIDEKHILTGSFNYTVTAERSNCENLILIKNNRPIAAKYLVDWNLHRQHSFSRSNTNVNVTVREFVEDGIREEGPSIDME